MVTPKVERTEESRNYGKFTISPLERGYGVTLGNASDACCCRRLMARQLPRFGLLMLCTSLAPFLVSARTLSR